MASEIIAQNSFNLTRSDGGELINWRPGAQTYNQVGSRFVETKQTANTTAATFAVPGGTLGWLMLRNIYTGTLTTNVVYLMSTTAGITIAQMEIGETAMFKAGSSITAPAISAAAGTCPMQIFAVEL